MELTRYLRTVGGHLWGVLLGGLFFAVGLVMSRITFAVFGWSPPRMPGQAAEAVAGYYLLSGSVVLAIGLAPVARRVRGSHWARWLILMAFLFVGFGVNGSIETSIYSGNEGTLQIVPILLLPCLLLAGVAAFVFRPCDLVEAPAWSVSRFFGVRSVGHWTWRLGALVVSFPAIYFLFHAIVSPIVAEYYGQGTAGLVLPDAEVILYAQFLRGFLLLLVALPIVIVWSGSGRQLVVLLGFAFFVLVAAYRVVLAWGEEKRSFEEVFSHWLFLCFCSVLGPQKGSFCIACQIRPCYLVASTF